MNGRGGGVLPLPSLRVDEIDLLTLKLCVCNGINLLVQLWTVVFHIV